MDFETQNRIVTRVWAVIVALAALYVVAQWLAR